MGPKLVQKLVPRGAFLVQVAAGWKWWNECERSASGRRKGVVRVNLDETSVARDYGGGKGFVSKQWKKTQEVKLVKETAPKRGTFTYLIFIWNVS